MINLQEFVRAALVQVIEGVKAAQEMAVPLGAMVNPQRYFISGGVPQWHESEPGAYNIGQIVEFDVAVVAVEETSIKGGIGVLAAIGYEAKKENDNSTVSRVKFSVPVFLPQQDVELKPHQSRMGDQSQLRRPRNR